MPFRLIGTIVLLLVVTIFAGANLDNRCDINFIFKTMPQVPVFLTAIVSFLAGAIIMIPFTFRRNKEKGKKNDEKTKAENQKGQEDAESKTIFDFKIKRDMNKNEKKEKKSWFQKDKAKENSDAQTENPAAEKKSEPSESSGKESD